MKSERYVKLLLQTVKSRMMVPAEREKRINSYLSLIVKEINKALKEIRIIGTHPREIRRIQSKLAPLVEALYIFLDNVDLNLLNKSLLLRLLLLLYEINPYNKKYLHYMTQLIKSTKDPFFLAEVADQSYDVGLFMITEQALNKLLRMKILNIEIFLNMAIIKYMKGKNEESLAHIQFLKRNFKLSSEQHINYLLAVLYLIRGELEKAKKLFKKIRH